MKRRLLFIFLLLISYFSQGQLIENYHKKLQSEKLTTEKRFQILDTLAILTENENFHPLYEEVATQCVNLGLKLKKYERTAYQTISVLYFYNNIMGKPEKGIPYANRILKFEDAISSFFKRGMLYQYRGDAYYFSNQINNSIKDYDQAEYYFVNAPQEYNRMIALTRFYRAGALAKKGEFVKATTDLQNAIGFLETTTDTFNIVASRNELSMLFSKYQFFDKAEEQRQEILKLKTISKALLASIYVNKANDVYAQNNFQEYEANMLKALDYAVNSDRRAFSEPTILMNLAQKYYLNNNILLAKEYENKFLQNYDKNSDFLKSSYQELLVTKLLTEKKYKQAREILMKQLETLKRNSNTNKLYKTHKDLAEVNALLNNYETAFYHQQKFEYLKDSIETNQKLKSLAYYQTQFETELKDNIIQKTKASLQLSKLQSETNKKLFILSLIAFLIGSIGILTYRKRFQIKKEKRLEEQFAQDLISAQDQERQHISSNLHDSLGQSLVLIKKQAKKTGDKNLTESITDAIEELRAISRNIYPPILEKLGLSYTLEQLSKQIFSLTAIRFNLALEDVEKSITKNQRLHIYRFVQEAINNSIKHAEATQIDLSMKIKEDSLHIQILDNGKGFNVEQQLKLTKSMGLQTLKHRIEGMKGKLTLESNTSGTNIQAFIPLAMLHYEK